MEGNLPMEAYSGMPVGEKGTKAHEEWHRFNGQESNNCLVKMIPKVMVVSMAISTSIPR